MEGAGSHMRCSDKVGMRFGGRGEFQIQGALCGSPTHMSHVSKDDTFQVLPLVARLTQYFGRPAERRAPSSWAPVF